MAAADRNKIKIDFEYVNNFTGNNVVFTRQLIEAFLMELERFGELLKEGKPTEEEFVAFRKAHHSISPSLQMLGLQAVHQQIEEYKSAYINQPERLNAIRSHLQQTILELIEEIHLWQSSS
jgi:hypothetical protein